MADTAAAALDEMDEVKADKTEFVSFSIDVYKRQDEAWAVADKAISYFKHAGQDDFLALGVAVVDVGQAQDRTTLLVDEAARRVGFDVQIRYTRIDERETASIEKIKI